MPNAKDTYTTTFFPRAWVWSRPHSPGLEKSIKLLPCAVASWRADDADVIQVGKERE